eukprot:jgi/Chlat1/4739/Chrsp300S04720
MLCHLTAHATFASKAASSSKQGGGEVAVEAAQADDAIAEDGHARSTDEVLTTVHAQFEEWDLRKKGYRHLIGFMLFTGLYFVVLFMQRDASVVYGVNSTISTLLPTDGNGNILKEFQDTASLHAWIVGGLAVLPTSPLDSASTFVPQLISRALSGTCGEQNVDTAIMKDAVCTSMCVSKQPHMLCSAPDDCSLSSMTDPNTKCWFSTPYNFSAGRLMGTQTTTLFMIDGNYTVCLLAPGGGVKGQVLISPANVTGIAVGIATTSTSLVTDFDYVDLNVITISDDFETDAEIAARWQYCGSTITNCEKGCSRVKACFLRCPGNVTASPEDIYQHCVQGMCTSLRLFPNVTVISNHALCLIVRANIIAVDARQPILQYLNIPGANGTLEDPSDPLFGCPAAYYDRINYPGHRPDDYCRAPVVNGDPKDYCQWQNAGDAICQPSCLDPNCGNDFEDCCSLRWPLNGSDLACCNLVASDAHAPLSFPFGFNNYVHDDVGLSGNNATNATTYVVGLTNRILAGILLHTTRYQRDNCSDSRFAQLLPNAQCRLREADNNPYGADPVFVRSSKFYIEAAARDPQKYYRRVNCKFWYQHIPMRVLCCSPGDMSKHGVPFGFFPMPAVNKLRPVGFPAVVAIDLNAEEAARFVDYLEDGFFLDQVQTKDLYMHFVTYNVILQLFTSFRVNFGFNDGGSISINPYIVSVSVERYDSTTACIRAALELVLLMCICAEVYFEGSDIYRTWVKKGSLLAHYRSFWNYVDAASIALLFTAVVTWVTFVLQYATRFDTPVFYNIYAATGSNRFGPHALKLNANGQGLQDFVAMLAKVNMLARTWRFYLAVNSIKFVIVLMLLRTLKLCDFQPRMGLLTRTLVRAAVDLGHFFFLAILVFLCYAMLALIAFGETIQDFSQLWLACVTLFRMLLGDTDVNNPLMQQNGLMYLVGVVFFWSYIILVFFILFNFLIAIVIDAFADVKADAKCTRSMGHELLFIIMDKWRAYWRNYFRSNYLPDRQMYLYLRKLRRSRTPAVRDKARKALSKDRLTLGEMSLSREELAHVLFNAGADQAPLQREAANPQAMAAAMISRINKLQSASRTSGPDPSGILETCLKKITDQSHQIERLQQQVIALQEDVNTAETATLTTLRQPNTPYGVYVQCGARNANDTTVTAADQVAPQAHASRDGGEQRAE